MANAPKRSLLKPGKRGMGCLGTLVFFIVAAVVTNFTADFFGKRLNPERYAQVYDCSETGDIGLTNTCGYDINLRYCFYLTGEGNQTFCRTNHLKPGQGVTTLLPDRAAQDKEIWSTAYWSCKAPFEPDMIRNINNFTILERGCRRPQESPSDGQ